MSHAVGFVPSCSYQIKELKTQHKCWEWYCNILLPELICRCPVERQTCRHQSLYLMSFDRNTLPMPYRKIVITACFIEFIDRLDSLVFDEVFINVSNSIGIVFKCLHSEIIIIDNPYLARVGYFCELKYLSCVIAVLHATTCYMGACSKETGL